MTLFINAINKKHVTRNFMRTPSRSSLINQKFDVFSRLPPEVLLLIQSHKWLGKKVWFSIFHSIHSSWPHPLQPFRCWHWSRPGDIARRHAWATYWWQSQTSRICEIEVCTLWRMLKLSSSSWIETTTKCKSLLAPGANIDGMSLIPQTKMSTLTNLIWVSGLRKLLRPPHPKNVSLGGMQLLQHSCWDQTPVASNIDVPMTSFSMNASGFMQEDKHNCYLSDEELDAVSPTSRYTPPI